MAGPGMTGRIVVLGGAGRLGRAAAEAFKSAGWQVASLVRGSSAGSAAPGTEIIEVDARDAQAVIAATSGADVVLHALNVPYADWERLAPALADTAIAAARESRATLIFPGNLYNYGAGMPARIDETTSMHPTSRKGAIRVAIETRMRGAAEGGLRTIVVRAGDYLGGEGRGSWFDRIIVKGIAAGRLTYPGPLDTMHEWAYLPDVAQAMVQLAERRERLAVCDAWICRPRGDGARIPCRRFTRLPAGLQDRLRTVAIVENDGPRRASFPRAHRYFLSVVDAACHRRGPAHRNHRRYSAHAA